MPVKSQKQRAYLNWRFGHAWVKKHHFDQTGKLPTYKLDRENHKPKGKKR